MNRQKINLTCYSSSSGSSDEESLLQDTKSATTSTRCDFFNINTDQSIKTVSPLREKTLSTLQNSVKRKFCDVSDDNTIKSGRVSSDFWQSETFEENWQDEMSVWGVTSVPVHSKFNPSTHRQTNVEPKSLCKYIPKRARQDSNISTNAPLENVQNDKQKESRGIPLYMHDNIRPAIRKQPRDVVPADSKLRIHDIFLKQCVSTITHHSSSIKDATWSNCGKLVASCGFDKSISVTDVEKGMQVFSSSFENYLTSVKFHPIDSSAVLTGSTDTILCWDTRIPTKPVKKYKYKDKIGQVLDICFLSDKEFLTSCDFVSRDSSDRCIMVWDFSAAAAISNEIFHEKYTCPRLRCHPFRKEFIAQTQGDYIAQFSSEPPYRMNKSKRYNCHKVSGYNVGCDINPNGGIVASGSADGQVVFYNYRTSNVITKIGSPHTGDVILDVNWHPVITGMCAASTWSGRIDIWH